MRATSLVAMGVLAGAGGRVAHALPGDARAPAPKQPNSVEFNRDVRPILSENCFACHGPDAKKRKSGLRLDTRAGAMADLGGYAAIVPGDARRSALFERITTKDADDLMPPADGGKRLTAAQVATVERWINEGAAYQEHWSFVPPARPPLPAVRNRRWPRNPIDHFILARLSAFGLAPSREAPRASLLRRASLDLTGLPPTPAEVDAFLADRRPGAYERVIDRLLASSRYGERMALVWLDAARFADTHGLHVDSHRDMSPYREWVIDAFNGNLPFDRFTIEQLAGDLLPEPTAAQRIATGFNRNHLISYQNSEVPERVRVGYVIDRVNTTATVWLGLTFGCAQCHDHKYDPLSQAEYYRFFAFFNSIAEKALDGDKGNAAPLVTLPSGATTMVMKELDHPRDAFVLARGEYDQPTAKVTPGTPAFLPPLPPGAPPNRLGLARWLVSAEHPLTARVTVNRLWQMVFGTGLVETSEDFGAQGEWPVHPALLDWLAVELVARGWDLKAMLRLIVTSATYRQSSVTSPALRERDPANRLLARGPRFRLPAEILRDNALAASGLLRERLGGRSVKPYQPAGVWEAVASDDKRYTAQSYEQDRGEALWRRSLYTFWKRLAPPPALAAFDAPSREACTVRRATTSTPLQALVLLNDPTYVEAARALAARAVHEARGGPSGPIARAFRLATARAPGAREAARLLALYRRQRSVFATRPEAARRLLGVGESPVPSDIDPVELGALTVVASAILNLDETITKE